MIRDIGNLCDPGGMRDRQMFRNQRADLRGIAVDGLSACKDQVEGADCLDACRNRIGGCPGVGAAECSIG